MCFVTLGIFNPLKPLIDELSGSSQSLRKRIADLGGTVLPGSPAEFGKLIAEETEKWGKVVKFAGMRPE
jgi:hypothetical protein